MNKSKTRYKCWKKIGNYLIKMEIYEEMCKEYFKVKGKGSEKATAFNLPGNPLVDGFSSFCFIIVSRVLPNTEYRNQTVRFVS